MQLTMLLSRLTISTRFKPALCISKKYFSFNIANTRCTGFPSEQNRGYASKKREVVHRKEVDFSYTGDHTLGFTPMDMSKPRLGFEDALKEIESHEGYEVVKKILSLEFADMEERNDYRRNKIFDKIRSPSKDMNSLEEKFVGLTLAIRKNINHFKRVRKDKRSKHLVLGLTNARRELMVELRAQDRVRYEWLRTEFGVDETVRDPYYGHKCKHKRQRQIAEARKKYVEVKGAKTRALKEKLTAERAGFDKYKDENLPKLVAELESLGVNTNTSIDSLLESIGKERVNMEIWDDKRRLNYIRNLRMIRSGRVKQMESIAGVQPDFLEKKST